METKCILKVKMYLIELSIANSAINVFGEVDRSPAYIT